MAKKKSKKRNVIIIFSLVVVIAIIAIALLTNKKEKPIEVSTTKVVRRTIVQKVSATGQIQAETEVKISPETSGEIIFLGVNEGDKVKTGQLLIKIKPDIVETMLEQSKAATQASKMDVESMKELMNKAEADLKRAQELYKNQYISQQEFDNANTAYQQSVANYQASLSRYQQTLASLKQVERNAARTVIYSPMDGTVTKVSVEKGETVVGTQQFQGTEMLRVSDLTVMNAIVDVVENDIVMVQKGDTATIEVDAIPDKQFKGVVVEIGHSAIETTTTTQDQAINFEVKIRILDPDERLRPGMSCSADITTLTKYNVNAVPLQSVTVRLDKMPTNESSQVGPHSNAPTVVKANNTNGGENLKSTPPMVVFVKDGDKAKMVTVKTGISDEGFIEIVEGLAEGQEVISGNFQAISKLLRDGSPIVVNNNQFNFKKSRKK
ncbi:MAG TPA: efflux RND transporter periplasmic adaptor subunit [Candidatus Kapabacteria bacterium]|nr:efflux RND transporter periplasmic adaptor subunit [Candidatus Kapabacteria bacterium]